jgi:RHH-type proline utilization regulon transcriptional repressor/proline dehydrogenase/delta 1-pyrroline-5-carboxylate dehydrogenase
MLVDFPLTTDDPIRAALRDSYRKDENAVLAQLLPLADIGSAARSRAWERARALVTHIRAEQVGKGGVDALLNEFALSTEEGVVLMCLAEALLRVPDSLTMDRLIRDKLAGGDWSSHLGNSDSLFVNASAWGLLLTGKVVNYNDEHKREQFGLLRKTMGRLGEPVIRASVRYAMQIMGTQFVMGTTIASAVERARDEEAKGYRYSYDMLGEGARTQADAGRYFDSYLNAIGVIGMAAAGRGPEHSPGISVKLSAIHPRYEFSHRARVMDELVPRLKQLALAAKAHDIGFTVDAEEADRLDLSLDVIAAVFADAELGDWQGFGIAVQAYQKRGLQVIEWARDLSLSCQRRMMLRLVKGAYWDTEIKLAQVEGLDDFPVFTRKAATDVSYQACARRLLEYRDSLYPQFATHNAYTVASILEMSSERGGYEFQRLHGMGDSLYDQVLAAEQVPCRVYAPVGVHADLLAYLVRRLLENGANSSFVNNIVDEDIPVESLLTDPVEQARSWVDARNPHIPLPSQIYGAERSNSAGADLTDPLTLEPAQQAMDTWLARLPLDYRSGAAENLAIYNPANRDEQIGWVDLDNTESMSAAAARAEAAGSAWRATAVTERAALLDALAHALEAHRDELMALCCKEAGKTLPDALAEVREAVDFCRYYAARAREADFASRGLHARGVVLCISPWNFPLAIFLGQVAAALAAGNTVLAKPAEQTSLIALRTLELMAEVGFAPHVVELVIARGPDVGATLVPDSRVQAVMFTGSTATGNWLAQTLALRSDAPIPLIAETGGQNCMIVDSTALPEQVVDDVITSGFQSAGQRCSALRVLFLQEDIADKVIAMIIGAMGELHLGDPALLSTDVGPVIDAQALQRLQAHVQYLDGAGRLLYACPEATAGAHHLFAPRLYEISNLSLLEQEVFGPIVHVVRYRAEQLDDVLDQINSTGFGLTFGMHSRIEQLTQDVAQRVQAGNIYINRNMIGAVVGVQPFGGRGLSGTGPKAGGPAYLERLVQPINQRVVQQPLPTTGASPDLDLAAVANAQHTWAAQPLNTRLSLLRQFIAALASDSDSTTEVLEHTLSAAREQLARTEQLLATPRQLPGPTGEANLLFLEPRGVLCISLDNPELNAENLMAWLTALATGNAVVGLASDDDMAHWQALGALLTRLGCAAELCSVLPLAQSGTVLQAKAIDGALVHQGSRYLQAAAQHLAQREGAILPLISSVAPAALLQLCSLEKTVSIDTTAAGGNASLMTMGSD